jgi:exodeoxyribonuclease VII large subunit
MAVPVKLDIMSGLNQSQIRLNNAVKRFFQEYDIRIESAKRAIPNLNNIIFEYTQKLDDRCERFINSFENYIKHQNSRVLQLSLNLKSPNQLLSDSSLLFKNLFSKLEKLWIKKIYDKTNNLTLITSRLNINNFKKEINNNDDKMENVFSRFNLSYSRQIDKKQEKLKNLELRLENCSFQKTIKRGFAIIKDEKGNVITSKSKAKAKEEIDILFNDGVLKTFTKKITKTVRKKSKPKLKDENQGSLF